MRVRFTPRARSNLGEFFAHVAAHDPAAAQDLVDGIVALIENLSRFPGLGRPAMSPGRYVLTVPRAPYQVFYRIAGEEVRVLTIRHTSRRRPRV